MQAAGHTPSVPPARMGRRKGPFDGLAANVAVLVDKTVESLWTVMNRPGPDGANWAEAGGFATVEDYRRWLAAEPDRLVAECRDLLWADHLLEPCEKALFGHVCAMAEGLAMLRRAVAEGVALSMTGEGRQAA